jgi:DNA repair exonuclease SbcCD ATPase subunit
MNAQPSTLNPMKLIYPIIVLVVSLALLGCDKPQTEAERAKPETDLGSATITNISAQAVKQEIREAVTATKQYAGESKEQFLASAEVRLQLLDAKINELRARTETLQADAKAEGAKAVDALKEQRAKLGEKFDEMKKASQDAWGDAKGGFETALSEIEKAYDNLKARFNG